MNIEQEIQKLKAWDDAYYNGTPAVPDATYDSERDRILGALKEIDPEHPYFDEVGAPAPSGSQWDKFTHTTIMGSLFKVNEREELEKWASDKGESFFLSEKADGCTIVAYYQDGKLQTLATRGNGVVGEDITANAKYFENVNLRLGNFTGILRGEGILYLDRFQDHFAPLGMANPRNAASGKVRDTKNPQLKRHIIVKWFDVHTDDHIFETWHDKFKLIESLGVETIPYYPELTLDDVWEHYNSYITSRREALNYWIDGLVVRVNDIDLHDSLGVTDKRPKGSRAIKFPAIGVRTRLVEVEINRGKGGRFTPVGIIDPVNIDGTTVTRVSMHGPDWIGAMDVHIGDEVEVAKAGDIIPQIIRVIERPEDRFPIQFPENCTLCEIELVRNGAYIECQNKSCEGETAGALAKWLEKTDIKGIGDSILQELVTEVKDIADLYRADAETFSRAARGSDKLGKKIFLAVQKTRTLPLAIFLSGLHIDSLGSTNGQRIANHFKTLKGVMEASEDEFRAIEGINENASKIHKGLRRKESLIWELDELLNIQSVQEGAFTGQSFCITGKMKSGRKRKEIEDWIKERGGTIKGVDKNLTYLVTDTPESGSSKNKKADKYGVIKITEKQLYDLVDEEDSSVVEIDKDNVELLPIKGSEGVSLFDSGSSKDAWLAVEIKDNKFVVIGSNLLEEGDPGQNKTRLGFLSWDQDFEDVDNGASPQSNKLNISSYLKAKNVELREDIMVAPSLEDLKKAIAKVTFVAWSEGDI